MHGTSMKISSRNSAEQYNKYKQCKYSSTALYQALFNAYGHIYITRIFGKWWLLGSVQNQRFPNVNITGNFSAQTFKGASKSSATLGFSCKFLDIQLGTFINIETINKNTFFFFINTCQHFVYK